MEVSRKTLCGRCSSAMDRTTETSILFDATVYWAAYTCSSPSCDKVLGTILKAGGNWNKPKTIVGDTFNLTKGYFKKL